MSATVVFFLAGLAAFLFVGYKLYQHAFLTRASDAWITLPGKTILMPENGYVQLLIPEDAVSVERGQPLLTVSSRLVARFNNGVVLNDLDPAQMRALVDATVFEVTLNSPCDCEITELLVRDGEFVHEDSPLLRLVNPNGQAMITATFATEMEGLKAAVGDPVTVRYLDGESDAGATISGLVRNVETGLLEMQILPRRRLPASAQHQPVSVTVHPAWLPVL